MKVRELGIDMPDGIRRNGRCYVGLKTDVFAFDNKVAQTDGAAVIKATYASALPMRAKLFGDPFIEFRRNGRRKMKKGAYKYA